MPVQHINIKYPAAPREPSASKDSPVLPSSLRIFGFTCNLPPLLSAYSSTSLTAAKVNAAVIVGAMQATYSLQLKNIITQHRYAYSQAYARSIPTYIHNNM